MAGGQGCVVEEAQQFGGHPLRVVPDFGLSPCATVIFFGLELVSCTARLTRELRPSHGRAAGGGSEARAAVALERAGGRTTGRGGLPIVLR